MGFKEGALERKRPGNPVRDLLGASSVPAMMPWWGEGHWETLCRPASGPALFRDEGTVLHEAEQEQSPLGQTTRLQLWLPPPTSNGTLDWRHVDAPPTVWRGLCPCLRGPGQGHPDLLLPSGMS